MNTVKLNDREYAPSKVVCIGRNYKSHIKEMGGSDVPVEPVIFIKPNSAVSYCQPNVFVPEEFGLLHYEVELCFLVGKKCKDVSLEEASSSIVGYAVGLDLTLRDRQSAAKKVGGPWALAKGFDGSVPLSTFVPTSEAKDPLNLNISLKLGDEVKQNSNTSMMIFKPVEILSFVSEFMTIEEGDIFMTGTPEGVGAVHSGDRILAEIEHLPALSIDVNRSV